MKSYISLVCLWLILCICSVAGAETHFVKGINDGFRTYAVIERNGVEYRTDQLGVKFNQNIWDELSDQDRKLLIHAYGWQLNRRSDHFGTTSSDMADWINLEQGWTQAAEALKQRHAEKDFPLLEPVFGKDAVFSIPEIYGLNPETVNSETYKEAKRLAVEVQADYAAGKQAYDMLVNANWEQVSIAVKTLSEPLIKIIIDNFITGFVTNGASKASELTATMYGFINDLKGFIDERMKPGSKPITPVEMIEKLEKFISEMEQTSETAVRIIEDKKQRLEALAEQIRQEDEARTQEKKEAAEQIISDLKSTAAQKPAPANLADFEPSDPEASEEAQEEDIRKQALEYYYKLKSEKDELEYRKNEAVNAVSGKYSSYLSSRVYLSEEPKIYLPDVFDGFTKPYFEIMDLLAKAEIWVQTDLPKAVSDIETHKTSLKNAVPDSQEVMDAFLPQIDLLHGKILWLDKYKEYLDFTPTIAIGMSTLRNFDPIINIIATPERPLEDFLTELDETKITAELEAGVLTTGIDKRESWIISEQNRYDSLRFNFENSLSYVIAVIRQIDRLHADTSYFIQSEYPRVCYESSCVYSYSINVEGINAQIQSKATQEEKELARLQAVEDLMRLRAEEEILAQKLIIAQNAHMNNVREMDIFFHSLSSRYRNVFSYDPIIEEFRNITGKTFKNQYDLWNDLVPDITYYYLGDGNWIRNASNIRTLIFPAVEKISGKTAEYYLLADLYKKMETEKSQYLALPETEFNTFMSDTTKAIESYVTAFQIAKVWGVDFPAWQLVMKTQNRQENLNSLYRFGTTLDPIAWSVKGRVVTPDGTGVPDVFLLLDGYYPGTNTHYLTLSTTTASNGTFEFDFVGSGDFTIKAWRTGYEIELSQKREISSPALSFSVNKSDVELDITAVPTAESGYIVSGRITDETGAGMAGVTVALTSDADTGQTTLTGPDGLYVFMEIPPGTYAVFPSLSGTVFSPLERTVSITDSSVTGQNFGKGLNVSGNLNGDGQIDLKDAVLALQISSGMSLPANLDADCNADGKIGLEDAVYVIKITSEN
ncbi:carboxypeptidase regulatory-like domain-containing protein [Desulfonema limicola]|nr:carboxypeptidase regulatory-like domain-containing protein [Desulfonema limicola]